MGTACALALSPLKTCSAGGQLSQPSALNSSASTIRPGAAGPVHASGPAAARGAPASAAPQAASAIRRRARSELVGGARIEEASARVGVGRVVAGLEEGLAAVVRVRGIGIEQVLDAQAELER